MKEFSTLHPLGSYTLCTFWGRFCNITLSTLCNLFGVGTFPANTLIALQRLQSLAFGFGTFA